MFFGVYGEEEIDHITLSGTKSILIRISECSSLKTINLYKNILSLDIDDIVDSEKITKEFKIRLMDSFFKLNMFLLNNDFDEIIVHCAMGISRSPAIMICIARILACEELERIIKNKFKFYNQIIFDIFENYHFIKKDININEVNFKGHFIENDLDDIVNDICILEESDIQNNRYLVLERKK